MMDVAKRMAEDEAVMAGKTAKEAVSSAEMLERYRTLKYTDDDVLKVVNLLVNDISNTHNVPIERALQAFATDNRIPLTSLERAGFLLEMQKRGFDISVAEATLKNAETIFRRTVSRVFNNSARGMSGKERIMLHRLNNLLKKAVSSGEYLTLEKALAETLKSKEFQEQFLNAFASEKQIVRRMALKEALTTMLDEMDKVAKKGGTTVGKTASSQMEYVFATLDKLEQRDKIRAAEKELRALYTYVKRLSRNTAAKNAAREYCHLSKRVVDTMKDLAEKARVPLSEIRPILGHRFAGLITLPRVKSFISHVVPWAPRYIGRDIIRAAQGKKPPFLGAAIRRTKWKRRLLYWGAAQATGYLIYHYFFKGENELELFLEKKKGPFAERLRELKTLPDDDIEFLQKDGEVNYNILKYVLAGDPEPLPQTEEELDRMFKEKAEPKLNPRKIKEFLPVMRAMEEETKKTKKVLEDKRFNSIVAGCKKMLTKGTEEERKENAEKIAAIFGTPFVQEIQDKEYDVAKVREVLKKRADPIKEAQLRMKNMWNHPKLGYFIASQSKGSRMTFYLSSYYRLDYRLEKFLMDNPTVYKMLLIGLGKGSIAASNVPGLLWDVRKAFNTKSNVVAFKAKMEARKKKRTITIADVLKAAKVQNVKEYVYKGGVKEGSIYRFAELYSIGNRSVKKQNEVMGYYNEAKTPKDLIIPKAMRVFGDPRNVALAVAKGNLKNPLEQKMQKFVKDKKNLESLAHKLVVFWRRTATKKQINELKKEYKDDKEFIYFVARNRNKLAFAGGKVETVEKKLREWRTNPYLEVAMSKGYVASDIYAQAGITKPSTIRFFKRLGLKKWVEDNVKRILDGPKIFDYIKRHEMLLNDLPTSERRIAYITNLEGYFSHEEKPLLKKDESKLKKSWLRKAGGKIKELPKPGGGVVPFKPLIIERDLLKGARAKGPEIETGKKEEGERGYTHQELGSRVLRMAGVIVRTIEKNSKVRLRKKTRKRLTDAVRAEVVNNLMKKRERLLSLKTEKERKPIREDLKGIGVEISGQNFVLKRPEIDAYMKNTVIKNFKKMLPRMSRRIKS
jgi:hypothetical protein